MGHISQAWTNLAFPSAKCVTDGVWNSTARVVIETTSPDFDDRFNSSQP
jgi:alpha-N-acetylglucosamine transferase